MGDDHLPTASTCVRELHLPRYVVEAASGEM